MKRILPLLLVLPLGVYSYACKNNKDDDGGTPAGETPSDQTGDPNAPGDGVDPNNAPTADELTTNPTEGIEPAAAVLETGAFTDGPVWHAQMGVLFFTTPLGEGALYRMLPDGSAMKVRDGSRALGTTPIGNAVMASGDLVTVEAKRVTRATVGGDASGAPAVVATGYGAGTPVVPEDGGAPVGDGTFDTLNDVVAHKSNVLFVTDPGYFETPMVNRLYRIDAQNRVSVVEEFHDVPRPNGIAFSPDQSSLYVGFSAPVQGTLPFVRKYIVNADGTLGEHRKFADVGPADTEPDGLAVDRVGNVYVATKAGIEVFKPDGAKWGTIAVPEVPTGLAFGGEDLKTLFITTQGVKIWKINSKIVGTTTK